MLQIHAKYLKTYMYKLACKDVNVTDIYVGHTIQIVKRKNKHKSDCTNSKSARYNFPVYKFIRKHGGFNNWSMIKIEWYPCVSKQEASTRERYWVERLKATLNTQMPSRTQKQYYNENKEAINKVKKLYYRKNIELVKEYQVNYRNDNKEYLQQYRNVIADRQHQKFQCVCGGKYTHQHKSEHPKSKKHIKYINSLEEIEEIKL